jgi:hypothetical protein
MTTALCSLWPLLTVYAGVSPEEAGRLKTDLMPLGGERAGNKDGTIPAWTGGFTTAPAGYQSGQPRPDPFAADKPLFTITAANAGQHAGKLDEGQLFLLKRYPDYRLHVYPSRRTAAAPQWVYDETFKNATRARLQGAAVSGAYGGLPFPIPKTGLEALWNFALRARPASFSFPFNSWLVDSNGKATLASGALNEWNTPYYQKGRSPDDFKDRPYSTAIQTVSAPLIRAGEMLMWHDLTDNSRQAWQYLVGQRRVRRAPTICCDTPNFVNSGVDFFDQAFVFNGPMDRYDWKLVGKREMYVPYNSNRFVAAKDREVTTPRFANPELVRWELHRVWEVEGTLRAGQRDVRPRRKVYLDEDTFIAVIGNTWDAQGSLWHTTLGFPMLQYEVPVVAMEVFLTMDLQKGLYTASLIGDQASQLAVQPAPYPDDSFTPEALGRRGVR